ncbi:hypothetical protein [Variovorax atrisoli]|uniref:hypothetical protein n=1 Tax=Variovorax atrisoli TaxID=3394203 RepID=UPI003394B41A
MRKKIFIRVELAANAREPLHAIEPEFSACPPHITSVPYEVDSTAATADFAPWYGQGIDRITMACQQQIERFVLKSDLELESLTIRSYFEKTKIFLNYCIAMAVALERDLTPADINRPLVDGFISYLDDGRISFVTQRGIYSGVKSVLKALCAREVIEEITAGDDATFPRNPFPGVHKLTRGEKALSKGELKSFARAVKAEAVRLLEPDATGTPDLLTCALLVIALHTGRNLWPLMELQRTCLRAHPKSNLQFLVLYKRRGHSTHSVAVRTNPAHDSVIESLPTIRPTVAALIQRAIELSDHLRQDAHPDLRDRVWLYRTTRASRGAAPGQVRALTSHKVVYETGRLIKKYNLKGVDGKPLQLNVRRLRRTFINRVFEILDGDLAATAAAAGNSVAVTDMIYLRPSEESTQNWMFMGTTLVKELLTGTIGASEKTPVGQCSDALYGEFAPKRRGETCMSFFNCFRCRNYVVTPEDLYRLFSFYWRILKEREVMDPRRWSRQFAHIVRLIDRDIVDIGVSKGVLRREKVEQEKARARSDPHPFWRANSILTDISSLPG